jgi:hypothetical protein
VKTRPEFHEDFSREEVIVGSSNRSFGFVFGAFCGCVASVKVWHGRGEAAVAWGTVAAIFFILAVVKPSLLRPLNRLWFWFGLVLNKLVSPLVMGLMFYGVILPIALAMRLFKKDPLRLKRDPNAASYWIERRPPGPMPDTMRNQF